MPKSKMKNATDFFGRFVTPQKTAATRSKLQPRDRDDGGRRCDCGASGRRSLQSTNRQTVDRAAVGTSIPIIADAAVEREFGTGALKITPAHDPLDNAIGERHGLPMPSVIDFAGKLNALAPEKIVASIASSPAKP